MIYYARFANQDGNGSLLYVERYRNDVLQMTDAAASERVGGTHRITMISVDGTVLRTSSGELAQSADGCTDGGCSWQPRTWCEYCTGGYDIRSVSGYSCCCQSGSCIADNPVNWGPCGAC